MNLDKTQKVIEWLETTPAGRPYSLDDLKEVLSIAIIEIEENDYQKYDDKLPLGVIRAMIEDSKASGVYYRVDNNIQSFKSRFTDKT